MSTPEVRRRPGRPFVAHRAIGKVQSAIYITVGLLLMGAAAFTLVGTVIDVIEGSESRPIADTGLFILDRVLLLFIIAELLYTLRLIDVGGRILVEPFLFIGLIAVVRKVLVVTAEAQEESELGTTAFLAGIAALAGLAFVLVLSIFLLRRSGVGPEEA